MIMNELCVLVFMILFHLIDDYVLQGWLATAKQKEWWRKQENYDEMYKNDYKAALICHGLSWSIMVHLPVIFFRVFYVDWYLFVMILVMAFCHVYIDNLKANKKVLNLVQDQSLHLFQIVWSWFFLVVLKLVW